MTNVDTLGTNTPSGAPTWSLYGTLQAADRTPLVGVPVVVYPPASAYDDANTQVINDVASAVTDHNGFFSISVASVPGIVWLIGVGTDEPVTIPDPGTGASVNIDSLMPAYVPNWQGGQRVAQGAGIASLRTSGSDLIATLTNGAVLPPVPFYSGSTLDADESVRALIPFSLQHDTNQAMRVLVLGGADGEGAGADTPGGRWLDVMTDLLRSAYGGPTGDTGAGYIPALYADPSMAASPWQPDHTGLVLPVSTSGPGNRAATLGPDSGDTSTVTWPAQDCSTITVHFATDRTNKGSFQVWVDGTQQATLSCDPGVGDPNLAKTWTWSGVRGQHTLKIVWDPTNASPALIQGAFFATSDTGVQVYDGCRGGDNPLTVFEIAGDQATTDLLAAIDPHLVVLSFGRTEMLTATADSWGQVLRGVFSMINTACPDAGILLVHDPMTLADANGASGEVPASVLTQFEDAARNEVVTNASTSMVSLARLWQPRPGFTGGMQDPWNWLDYPTGDFTEAAHTLVGRYITRVFQRVLAGGNVTAVAGRTGNVTLTAADISPTSGGFTPQLISGGNPEPGMYPDGSGEWTPLPRVSALSQQRGLVPLKQALSNGTARIAVVGDGKAEGGGSADIANRWQAKMAAILREQMFASPTADQGVGYVPVWNTVLKSEAAFGTGATFTGVEDADYHLIGNAGGFGARSAQLLTVGTTVTFPSSTVRYLTVCYTIDTATGGTFNVLVDGQSVATVDTTVVPTTGGDAPVSHPVGRQVIDLESVDTRQISFVSVSGTPTVEGVLLTTSTTGLTVVDAASSNFALVSSTITPGSADDLTANALATAALSVFDPHLIILATGTAEQQFADDSTWRTALASYLTTLTTACPDAGVLLVHGAARPEDARTEGVGLDRCATYEAASQVITDTAQFASLVRESTLWQPNSSPVMSPENPVEQDPSHWLSGDFYPSDLGHARIAEHLAQTLTPGSGNATAANTLTVSMLDAALASDMSNPTSASRALLDATYERADLRYGLIPWNAAYAGRRTTLVPMAILSDFEGVGATAPVYENKWQALLREGLADVNEGGFITPGFSAASGLPANATFSPTSGATAPTVVTTGQGTGGKVTRIPSGGKVTFPALTSNATSFRLWYRSDATYNGTATVAVDGTSVGTLSSTSATEVGVWPATGTQPITGGAAHTITVTAASGTVDLAALEYFVGDESTSVHLYDHSQQGLTLATAVSAGYTGMWQMLAATEPALLVVMLGSHDYGGDTAAFTGALTTLQQNVSQYLPSDCSVLLVMPPRPVVSGADPTQWDTFTAAVRATAGLNPSQYAFLDLQDSWPVLQAGGATSLGLMAESDNPFNFSSAGHQAVADALLKILRNFGSKSDPGPQPVGMTNSGVAAYVGTAGATQTALDTRYVTNTTLSTVKPAQATRAVGQGELVVNVKDYGAKGDGTTDDTAAIQAALNAAGVGSKVSLPLGAFGFGRYKCGPLTVPAYCTLEGASATVTRTSVPTVELYGGGLVGRSVTDGVTSTTTTITSASASFSASDVGALVTGAGIPGGTSILSVTNATTAVLSNAATANATGVALTIAPVLLTLGAGASIRNLEVRGPSAASKTVATLQTSPEVTYDGAYFVGWGTANVHAGVYYSVFSRCGWKSNGVGVAMFGCYNVDMNNPRFDGRDDNGNAGGQFIVADTIRPLTVNGGSIENYGPTGAIQITAGASQINMLGTYWETLWNSATTGAIGINAQGLSSITLNLIGHLVYLWGTARWVNVGSSNGRLVSWGHRFACAATSPVTPTVYQFNAGSMRGELGPDDWTDVALGAGFDGQTGVVPGMTIRRPFGYGTGTAYSDVTLQGRAIVQTQKTVTANYTATGDDYTILCNSASPITVTLPDPLAGVTVARGRRYVVKNLGAGTVTLQSTANRTIDGSPTQSLPQYQSMIVENDFATGYQVIASASTPQVDNSTVAGYVTNPGATQTALDTRYPNQVVSGLTPPTTLTYASLQSLLTSAAMTGQRPIAAGSITTSSTLVISGDCDLSGLTINYTGTSTAVQIGAAASPVTRARIKAPRIINSSKTATGWSQTGVTGTVGLDVVNAYACAIDVPYVQSFATGLQIRGASSNGSQQTTINLSHLDNNKINIVFTGDSTGWANQNYVFGGRCSHNSNEGSQVSGTRHVQFQNLPNAVNGNNFFGTSLESPNVVEYHIEAANTQWNTFYGSRFENTGGDANRRILSTGNSKNNRLVGGAYIANVTQTTTSPALPFDIDAPELTTRRGGSATSPVLVLENVVSSTAPVWTVMAAGAGTAGTSPITGYTMQSTSQMLVGKRSTDTYNRIQVDALNGRLWLGDGTAAPVSYLMGTGAFFLFGGATTVGSMTDGGSSLGASTNYRFDYIRARTAVVTGANATASRPAAATAGAGAMFFDTTLGKPIWCTGTAWVDATGATV